ncbi:putative superkiller protein [Elsinoe australis]|uniref:Putative superkiller protein n=1 Tax=Elsinoe australis TaxID=40998 RepID=A0A4U7BA29_9PEZI|nr:putative superkiller protein [Elsinoe australis]
MSGPKAALKAAKSALDSSEWDEAIKQSELVLEADKKNHFAKLFLGRAYEKKGDVEKSAKVYHEAANSKPDDTQAWQGLVSLYESQGSKYLDEYGEVAVQLAVLFGQAGDLHRCQTTIDKLTGFAKKHGTPNQYKRSLQVLLPGSSIWEFLEGRVLYPSHTFKRLVEITEKDEQATISKEIAERRTRLGARLGKVTEEVKREVFEKSDLEGLYRGVIDWTDDDAVRREYEEKLFQRAYDTLTVMPKEIKEMKRAQVVDMAKGMVIVKHPFRLAWDVHLEWHDVANIADLDVNILLEYVEFFPDAGLTKVLRAFLRCEISPFSLPPPSDQDEAEKVEELTSEDRLLLMAEGLGDGKSSPLAHRLTAEYYLQLEEFESAIDTARNGLNLLRSEEKKADIDLQEDRDALNTILATCLVHYQSPKNHPEARELLQDILDRKKDSAPALVGLGLIYEEQEDYPDAVKLLTQALKLDSHNIRVKAEAAWCSALSGHHQEALDELEECLDQLNEQRTNKDDPKSRALKALTQFRIGRCVWEIDPSKLARKDRNGAYSHFLATIKTDPNFAPAYSNLGFYYADYARDKKRARQCFQKAFELSAAEVEAAERLARAFADQGEWEIVELVAQRVVDSGRTRPPPGSKKKGISWPYSALGVVQMMRQEYTKAITSFLSALRISPDDYHSYVGLGESYHNSGRYNSASRTFHYAEQPHDGIKMKISGEKWFTEYMLANVHRELGDYDEAIDRLKTVLKERSDEFGVLIALLQTYVERAWKQIDTGFFGKAAGSAKEALDLAGTIEKSRPEAFNLWKAVGDACSVFYWAQGSAEVFSADEVRSLITGQVDASVFDLLADVDHVSASVANGNTNGTTNGTSNGEAQRKAPSVYLQTALLAYKRAIHCCSNDIHAQAVAWYNLGWAEYRVYCDLEGSTGKRFSLASVRCFKRAIEMEAGNPEFWNSLGVVTSNLNVKVAQHAFVRSLYLNERSAQAWTNLGVLYFNNNDHELAHQAFSRAQSTDPDFAHAWIGEGLIALSVGQQQEALSHFVHAFEISDSSSLIAKKAYTISVFDSLISQKSLSPALTSLIEPLFALHQLHSQIPSSLTFQQLSALLSERVSDHISATTVLLTLCTHLESQYEETESPLTLLHFAHAKSDLARNLLATSSFDSATEHATTALDLTTDFSPSVPTSISVPKIRLSSHLTLGLAHFYTKNLDDSIAAFRAALSESDADPAVICLLSRVLWAHGGDEERGVAKEQLMGCVEEHPDHVDAWVLLGAMSGMEDDVDAVDAIREDLLRLQALEGVSEADKERVGRVLVALAGTGMQGDEKDSAVLEEVKRGVMLAPEKMGGWTLLSRLGEEDGGYAADMALLMAKRSVPPFGPTEADELAGAYAGTGVVGDAQRSVMLAPWRKEGWSAFGDALDEVASG